MTFNNKMYYEKSNGSYLIFAHHKNSSLPFSGWFHNCIFCSAITTREEDFDYQYLSIKLLSCKECKKNKRQEQERDKIIKWIEINIPNSRCSFLC